MRRGTPALLGLVFGLSTICPGAQAETIVSKNDLKPGVQPSEVHAANVECGPGQVAVGGGFVISNEPKIFIVRSSYPDPGGRAWVASVVNQSTTPHDSELGLFVICR